MFRNVYILYNKILNISTSDLVMRKHKLKRYLFYLMFNVFAIGWALRWLLFQIQI